MAKQRNYLADSTQNEGLLPGMETALPTDYPPYPQDGPIRDFPVPQGPLVPAPTEPQFDLNAWYQQQLGRAPDQNELTTDTENISKYGPEAFQADFMKRLDNRTPAEKGYTPIGTRSPNQVSSSPGMDPDLVAALKGLFPGGGFNQDIVNRRTDSARDQLNRYRQSQTASNRASLANRGLIGSGPEITAQNRLETDIADRFSNALNDIYANESSNADARMMQALGLFGGLGTDQARLGLDRELGLGRLDLDRMLGTGGLALQNLGLANDYNINLGRLGLDRDRLQYEIENGNIDQLIQLITQLLAGANSSAGGYI